MEIAAAAAASQLSCSTFAMSKIPHDPPTSFFYRVTAVAQPGPPAPGPSLESQAYAQGTQHT